MKTNKPLPFNYTNFNFKYQENYIMQFILSHLYTKQQSTYPSVCIQAPNEPSNEFVAMVENPSECLFALPKHVKMPNQSNAHSPT